MILSRNSEALAEFELWRYDGDCTELSLIRTGPKGDKARALQNPESRIVWTVEARSPIELMSKYYAYMEWGNYHSDCPDLDAVPFFYTDALETLAALPKNVKPLSEFNIFADGHSEPPIPGPIPCILIQEGAVFAVNIHVFGDFCGHGEPPLNHVALIAEAQALIAQTKPHLFKRRNAVSLICPKQLAEEMIWV